VSNSSSAPPQELKRIIGVFGLTMMNVATIASLRNLPFSADYGAAAAFWLTLGALAFFLPVALVAAELASAFPQTGGVYLWIRAGLGNRIGMMAVWLQWLNNIVWYPTILTFIAGTLAYLVDPNLLNDPTYVISCVLTVFWIVSLISLRGVEATATISTVGVWIGTFVPIAAMILLCAHYLWSGNPPANPMAARDWLPNITSWHQLPLIAGLILGLSGIEMPAVHARQVINPQRTFPRATAISVVLILACTIFGTLSIVTVVPRDRLNLVSGVIEAFSYFLKSFGMEQWLPVAILAIAAGALAGVSNWVIGPCRALFASARDGDLPPFFQKRNRFGIPYVILLTQGAVVSIVTMVFVLLPDVSSSYWLLTSVSTQLYMMLYMLMFIAAIRVRLKGVAADFQIPGGKRVLIGVSLLGFTSALFGFLVPFIPLENLSAEQAFHFHMAMVGALAAFLSVPLILYFLRKPSWTPKNLDLFE
jgi:amino acid transporter